MTHGWVLGGGARQMEVLGRAAARPHRRRTPPEVRNSRRIFFPILNILIFLIFFFDFHPFFLEKLLLGASFWRDLAPKTRPNTPKVPLLHPALKRRMTASIRKYSESEKKSHGNLERAAAPEPARADRYRRWGNRCPGAATH